MKNRYRIYFIYLAFLFTAAGVCTGQVQDERNIPGVYSFPGSHDPQGGTNLILSPDSVFIVAGFGVMEYGTWDVYKDYLILEPKGIPEDFYMTGSYDPERENVYLQFDGFTDVNAVYSFDNDDFTEAMHPVFNPWPNCTIYPYYIEFEPYTYSSLQLATRGHGHKDEAVSPAYNFILPADLNDFTVLAIDRSDTPAVPLLLVIEGEDLRHEYGVMARYSDYETLKEEEKQYMAQVKEMILDPDIASMYLLGNGMLDYLSKEKRRVFFDDVNLFEANCDDYYNGRDYDDNHDVDEYEIYDEQ